MFINQKLGELNLKIVYYGPAYSGKTTNLEVVYQRTPASQRTEMISLKTRGDRTLFFDYVQIELPKIYGLRPKFNLYTVPGQIEYTATRRSVLQGVDGIIFVADSQPVRQRENVQSLIDLYTQLKTMNIAPGQVSLVIQFNKRDTPNALPVETLCEQLGLNNYQLPYYEAAALRGEGVLETLKKSIQLVITRIQQTVPAP